jgi:hypothetical protein
MNVWSEEAEMQVVPSEHCERLRIEAVLANMRMFAAQLDAVAGLPRQARGSRLCAHCSARYLHIS